MSERINIKDLTLEEPEKKRGLPFDPERDITEEDWEGMKNDTKKDRAEHMWYFFAKKVMSMNILLPEKMEELDLKNEETWQGMRDYLKKLLKEGSSSDHLVSYATAMKIIFPERFSEFYVGGEVWEGMKNRLNREREAANWWAFAILALEMKILFPDRSSEFLDDTAREGMEKLLKKMRSEKIWYNYFQQAMQAKVLFPDRASDLYPDKTAWKEIKEHLMRARTDSRGETFLEIAMHMKLLAAEEIKITDQGLEIIMPKENPEFKEETPPMPQTRKF